MIKFSGEQFVPNLTSSRLQNDHLERYQFVLNYTKNKKVLDIACGTGYGSHLVASNGAKFVYGKDIQEESIKYAKENFKKENLNFNICDATKLDLGDNSIDVVISFETIEHIKIDRVEIYLRELKRVLKDDGIIIISTPNKRVVSPFSKKPKNIYHTKEYTIYELKCLLKNYFVIEEVYGQRIMPKIINFLPVRFFALILEKYILKRKIGKYLYGEGPNVVKFSAYNEPRYIIFIIKKHENNK